jgi:hypothetical protein
MNYSTTTLLLILNYFNALLLSVFIYQIATLLQLLNCSNYYFVLNEKQLWRFPGCKLE